YDPAQRIPPREAVAHEYLACALPAPADEAELADWVRGVLAGAEAAAEGTIPKEAPSVYEVDTGKDPSVQAPTQEATAVANGNGNGTSGLSKQDFGKFVQFFRQASPYVEGHRGKTFVIVIPGNVSANRTLLQNIMSDIALLHGLGASVIVVVGAQQQIDDMLHERNMVPKYVGGYRITDREAMRIAIEAAGQIRTTCEQFLSKGPAIPMFRRHTKGDREVHFEPALRVISGNYVTAKRRGVLEGVDFGLTGEVRFVLKDDIKRQLESGNIVLLSNIGFTAAGEVLNCNTYDVGLHAAAERQLITGVSLANSPLDSLRPLKYGKYGKCGIG
ncbi:Amino-acid acetyltransferase, partial [Tetrabaena socialis]